MIEGKNPALELIPSIEVSDFTRLYANSLKTFEYDLAMERDNRHAMLDVLLELWPSKTDDAGVKKELNDLKSKILFSLLYFCEFKLLGEQCVGLD